MNSKHTSGIVLSALSTSFCFCRIPDGVRNKLLLKGYMNRRQAYKILYKYNNEM